MQMLLCSGGADLDFYIKGVFSYELFGQTLWITTTHLSMLAVSIGLLILGIFVNRTMKKATEVPSGFQNVIEYGIEFLENLIHSNMKSGDGFLGYVGTVFLFVLVSNLSGLFGLRPPTADFGTTFAIGLTNFFIIQFTAIRVNKLGYFKSFFEPVFFLFPINVIGELAVPVSMSMRLFANLLGGTIITALWYGLLPMLLHIGIPSFLHAYLDVFSGCIQTYVLCMLTTIYIGDKQ